MKRRGKGRIDIVMKNGNVITIGSNIQDVHKLRGRKFGSNVSHYLYNPGAEYLVKYLNEEVMIPATAEADD